MAPEVEALNELDHVVPSVMILYGRSVKVKTDIRRSSSTYPVSQLLQDIHLHQGLLMEPLLVPDDLHRYQTSRLVIDTPNDLAEASFAQNIQHLVAVRQMIANDDLVIATLIIIAKIRRLELEITDTLLRLLGTTKVNVLEVNNLSPFKNVQIRHLQRLCRAYAFLRGCSASEVIKCLRSGFEVPTLSPKAPHFLISSSLKRIHW